jgi:hypothetical protein
MEVQEVPDVMPAGLNGSWYDETSNMESSWGACFGLPCQLLFLQHLDLVNKNFKV